MPAYPFEITGHNIFAGDATGDQRLAQILITTELHLCTILFLRKTGKPDGRSGS